MRALNTLEIDQHVPSKHYDIDSAPFNYLCPGGQPTARAKCCIDPLKHSACRKELPMVEYVVYCLSNSRTGVNITSCCIILHCPRRAKLSPLKCKKWSHWIPNTFFYRPQVSQFQWDRGGKDKEDTTKIYKKKCLQQQWVKLQLISVSVVQL